MRTSYVDQFQQSLEDLASEIAETLVEYPNSLPDHICAVGEEADQETVQAYVSELLAAGWIEDIENMLSVADDERENDSDAATIEAESEGKDAGSHPLE